MMPKKQFYPIMLCALRSLASALPALPPAPLVGCVQQESAAAPTIVKQDPRALQYIRDERVGLCFARYSFSFNFGGFKEADTGYSIALVDCEKLKTVSSAPVENLK
jgi:hypothetical protein